MRWLGTGYGLTQQTVVLPLVQLILATDRMRSIEMARLWADGQQLSIGMISCMARGALVLTRN